MKTLLIALALAVSQLTAEPADIASVNFDAIKNDLQEYYLAKPENAELKKAFDASAEAEKRQMDAMQKSILNGGKPSLDLMSAMPGRHFEMQRKLEADLKKELYKIVSRLGLKYELIYDASDADSIIYAKSSVEDVTTPVKQAIIDLQEKK
jgi:hypothetical protein